MVLISYSFYVLQHGWYMQNNSVVALLNMLAISRLSGNIHCFDRKYHPGNITLQVSVQIIKYLVPCLLGCVTCCIFGFNCGVEEIEIEESGMNVW